MSAEPSLTLVIAQASLGVLRHVALGWSVGVLIAHFPFTPSRWKRGEAVELASNSWRHWHRMYEWADNNEIKPLMKKILRALIFLWIAALWVSLDMLVINRFSPVSLTVFSLPLLPLIGLIALPFSLWFGTRDMHEQLSACALIVERSNGLKVEQALCNDQGEALAKQTSEVPAAKMPTRRL